MLANVIHLLILLLTLVVFGYILSTWVFPPFHEFRRMMSSLVDPFLNPIRKLIPPAGMIDFSAFILLILLQVLDQIVTSMLH
jgi:YggT family protein